MPMTVGMREALELKKVELWCEVYKIAEKDNPRKYAPAFYADRAVEKFENTFSKEKICR
ncbi:hypothetical protein CPT_Phriendly_022 [Vibrio phage Phriendly]|nr:hypothetical protein CPT_Phriendly_022 [Vibrio phage Phriendly]